MPDFIDSILDGPPAGEPAGPAPSPEPAATDADAAPAPAGWFRQGWWDLAEIRQAHRDYGGTPAQAFENWQPPSVAEQAMRADPQSLHQRLVGGPGTRAGVAVILAAHDPRYARAAGALAARAAIVLAVLAIAAYYLAHL